MFPRVKCDSESISSACLLTTDLSKLSLPQLLPEDQLLTGELGGRDVLPGEGVHGEGGDSVHVAAGDALQPHDVRLRVVRRAAVEALVGRALGDVGLGVASPTGCRREQEEERVYSAYITQTGLFPFSQLPQQPFKSDLNSIKKSI